MTYSDNAKRVYNELYLVEGESITECHERIAFHLAKSVEERQTFIELLDEQIFRPNTPAMTNAGVKKNANLMACFILGLDDDMKSITEMWETCSFIYEGGGGAGIPITNLREKDAPISTGGFASGPLSYLGVVQQIADTVKSGGRSRRAANLVSAWYNHPDNFEIINCKRDKQSFSAMNLSVLVDKLFMSNVLAIRKEEINNYHIAYESPSSGTLDSYFSTKELWDNIVKCAWETGDPGLLFYDRINRDNPFPSRGDIVCTNPCGEVAQQPWSCCDLGHVNLMKITTDIANDAYGINWEKFARYIHRGVLFLNRIIDNTHYVNDKFKTTMMNNRPIGLGIMGFADLLYAQRKPYNSSSARRLLKQICKFLSEKAFEASLELGKAWSTSRINIPAEDRQHFYDYVQRFCNISKKDLHKLANSTVTCIAPTGSTAISADCSYSFEPQFALVWEKVLHNGERMPFVNKYFEEACEEEGIELTSERISQIKCNKGSIKGLGYPKWMEDVFVTAHDIQWEDRVSMQAVAQEHITMSVSSTINLPNSATEEDISHIYMLAYESGLKGITVYRDGCLDKQPVDFGSSEEKEGQSILEEANSPINWKIEERKYKRPMVRQGKTVEVETPDGKLYVTGNYDDGNLMELFLSMSNQDSRVNHLLNSYGRLFSRSLQHGTPITALIDTMRGGGGQNFFLKLNEEGPSQMVSGVIDAVACILDEHFAAYMPSQSKEQLQDCDDYVTTNHSQGSRCPNCGKYTLHYGVECRGGTCLNCGYSNCG